MKAVPGDTLLNSYSNFGYCVLGRVVEAVTGRDFHAWVRANLWNKLGLPPREIGFGRSLVGQEAPNEVAYYVDGGPNVPNVPSVFPPFNLAATWACRHDRKTRSPPAQVCVLCFVEQLTAAGHRQPQPVTAVRDWGTGQALDRSENEVCGRGFLNPGRGTLRRVQLGGNG